MAPFTEFCSALFPCGDSRKAGAQATSDGGGVWSWPTGWLLVSGLALLIRLCTGLSSYSGAGTPPLYGDYEAQRHWMEITLHTPVREWYSPTEANNLSWWGLDYPPLTAYQSYAHGLLLHWRCPEAVALQTSRGFESPESKVLMRWTVVLSDLLVFFPAALLFVATFLRGHPPAHRTWALAMLLLQPGLLLIDHGHFQYNCLSLGFTLAAAALICEGHLCLGSAFFCLAINHKHMSLYFAPAFFGHLLGRCLHSRRPALLFCQLGATVLLTFAVCWWPFLHSKEAAIQVLQRLVPLARGLFEDHVANFWCVSSVVLKWKRWFSVPVLARLALFTTVAFAVPPMAQQVLFPSPEGLLLAMLNCSLAFFFFAFQVHEKSILMPLLPAACLALLHPRVHRWFAPVATFSMFPLLVRDGLALPYIALQLLFLLLSPAPEKHSLQCKHGKPGGWFGSFWAKLESFWVAVEGKAGLFVGVCMVGLHLAQALVPPPGRFPYLHAALFVTFSFVCFVGIFVSTNVLQWTLGVDMASSPLLHKKTD